VNNLELRASNLEVYANNSEAQKGEMVLVPMDFQVLETVAGTRNRNLVRSAELDS